jgi:hypothetical protein
MLKKVEYLSNPSVQYIRMKMENLLDMLLHLSKKIQMVEEVIQLKSIHLFKTPTFKSKDMISINKP